VEVRTPHTIVLSDAGKGVARRVAGRFERFRAAINVIWPWARVDPSIPPLILAPRDEDGLKVLLPEYWQGKDTMHPAGVFVGDLVHPWIALRADLTDPDPEAPNPYHLIQHEYVHLVIRLNFERVPAWLNEGMAELLGGITVRGDGIVIGAPIEHHVHLLRDRELLPVEKLFQIDYRSREYSERERANLFYAQSWAFAHFLVLDPKASRDPRYKSFVGKVVDGMEPMAALRAGGLDPVEIDRALKSYTRQVAYRGTSRAARIDLGGEFQARDVSEAEWLAACGAFLVHRGRAADGGSLLDKAERKQPDLATVQRARGFALYREGQLDKALERLQQATRLDPSDPTGWLLAGLLARTAASTSEGRAVARADLERALELAPEHAVAHRLLAETLLAQGEVPAAVDHALRAAKLEPGSGQHRLTLARTLAAAGRTSEARAQAEKAAGLGLDAPGNAAGLALLESLADARESVPKTSSSPPDASAEPSKAPGPIPVVSNAGPPPGRPADWGVFVDIGSGARLTERGSHVEIGVPAGAYDLSAEIDKVNAPRLLRRTEGDFMAEVTVSRVPQPDRRQALPGRAPFNGAGLLLWQDDKNYVRLEVAAFIGRNGATTRFALFQGRREGRPADVSKTETRLAAVPATLRLERRGRTLLGSVRQGSEHWIPLGQFEADLPPTVYVGVAAVNASQGPFTAEFEGLTVVPTPLK
jgi:tetratricopeptide (TPR) repeat protein/regulation of enolase protein 1 (concanavalin A-like superfamily)